MKTKRNQTDRSVTFSSRRPPGSGLLRFFLFSLLISVPVCLVSSCRHLPADAIPDDEFISVPADSVSYTIGVHVADNISDSTHMVSRLDLFIYKADGMKELDSWQHFDALPDSITIKSTGTSKIAVAIANSPRNFNRTAIERYDSIELLCYEFDEDSPQMPLMSGVCNLEKGSSPQLILTPLMARVVLAEISNTMKNYVRLEDPRIWLTNMNADAEALRTGGFRPSEFLYGERKTRLPYDIGIFAQNPGIELFCYPNDSPSSTIGTPATALMLECEISGRTCRFPVELPPVYRNSTIYVDITVNGPDDAESSTY